MVAAGANGPGRPWVYVGHQDPSFSGTEVQVQMGPGWVVPGLWGSAHPPEWPLIHKRRLYVKVAVESVTLGGY